MTGTERDPIPRIREILNRDREWNLYALGDLAPSGALQLPGRTGERGNVLLARTSGRWRLFWNPR